MMLGTVLGVWAHPDDEAFLSAGVMAMNVDGGGRVVVVTATRGELGAFDADRWPPAKLGPERERELDASLGVLGVREHHLLGFPDGGCSDVPEIEGTRRIAEVLERVQPDTVLTFGPDGFTGHPDHRTVSRWVDRAVLMTGADPRILHATATPSHLTRFEAVHARFDVFFAGQPSVTEPWDLAIELELSGAALDRKLAALRAQTTQTAPLIEAMGADLFGAWVASETFVERRPMERGTA